jgi:methyl-accepting chemotaxis protein
MSVARRAMIGFAIVFVIAMSACTFVFVEAGISRQRLETYRAGNELLDADMWSIRSDFYNFDDQMNMYVAVLAGGHSAQQLQLAETTYREAVSAHDRLARDLDRADRLSAGAGLGDLLARLRKDFNGYSGFADQTRAAAQAGDVAKAIYLSTVGNLAPSNDMMPTLDRASQAVQAAVDAEMDRLEQQQRLVQVMTATGGSVLALVILGFAVGMRRWVLVPVALLQRSIAAIASGERSRSERVAVRSKDEFGQLARCFNTMLEALSSQDAELQREQAAREGQLQATFEQQRAAEQMVRTRAQSVVDETASTVADDLREVMAAVQVVRDAANTIDDKVNTADEVTRSVVSNAREADRVVNDLELSLRRVAGMTELIAGVADQTKLLALNATIEAARAGEAGRGGGRRGEAAGDDHGDVHGGDRGDDRHPRTGRRGDDRRDLGHVRGPDRGRRGDQRAQAGRPGAARPGGPARRQGRGHDREDQRDGHPRRPAGAAGPSARAAGSAGAPARAGRRLRGPVRRPERGWHAAYLSARARDGARHAGGRRV